jgi:hypothetical protein
MAMKHAWLGLVIEQAGYAGDLERRFHERFPFWRPGSSPHPDLKWLQRRGLIEAERRAVGEGTHPLQSVWYESTSDGVSFFEGWMREGIGPDAPPLRSELLMKLGFRVIGDELLVQLYRDARAQAEWCVERMNALAGGGDLEALAERDKEMPVLSPVLLRDAETVYLQATNTYLSMVRRELRRVYELRTGRRLEA